MLSRAAQDDLSQHLNREFKRSLMSHTLRKMQESGDVQGWIIGSEDLSSLCEGRRLPTPKQQADAFIRWIGDNQQNQFLPASSTITALAALIGLPIPITENGDATSLTWLTDEMKHFAFYNSHITTRGQVRLQLTTKGWDEYEKLKRINSESRTAFIAMKFGDELLDRVVQTCFKPAVTLAGFELRKLTDEQPAGLIDDQIRAALISARFVIADLTRGSHGAYWEAGFAEGLGLPVIYTCEKMVWQEKQTHFDTNHLMTIVWEESALPTAGNLLVATIRATLRGDAKQAD
jgi:hypothetical protein